MDRNDLENAQFSGGWQLTGKSIKQASLGLCSPGRSKSGADIAVFFVLSLGLRRHAADAPYCQTFELDLVAVPACQHLRSGPQMVLVLADEAECDRRQTFATQLLHGPGGWHPFFVHDCREGFRVTDINLFNGIIMTKALRERFLMR